MARKHHFCRIRRAIKGGVGDEARRAKQVGFARLAHESRMMPNSGKPELGRGGAMADSEGAVAPAEPASGTPPPLRLGGFVVASGLVVSIIIHLLVIGPVLILGSRLLQSEPATSMTVDLVTPEELAALTQKPAQPEAPKPDAQRPETQQPPTPTSRQQSDTLPTPQPPIAALASASDAFAMPFLPKPPPSEPVSPDTLGPADQLATLVGAPSVTDLNGGGVSEFKANLTSDEVAAFAARVQSCWHAPAGVASEPKLYVVLRVSLRRDGALMAEPALQAGSASTLGPALLDSARRALRQCEPYAGLPPAKYDEWHVLDLRFTPSGLSAAGTASGGRPTPRPG